jgi:ABC-2 type transport system permease protein
MRTFLDVFWFDVRLHLRGPLTYGLLLIFLMLHLLTLAQVGIHLTDSDLIAVNSPYLIARTALVLSLLGTLPAVIFVASATARDHERSTVELFYTTPARDLPFVLGRLAAGLTCATLVALAGLLGTLFGGLMPWIGPDRVVAFEWQPYLATLLLIVLPSVLVFGAPSFTVGALTRSTSLAFLVAPAFVVVSLVITNVAGVGGSDRVALADPSGLLALETTTRLWSPADLNARIPLDLLVVNRALWTGLAVALLAFVARRLRLTLPSSGRPPSAPRPRAVRPAASTAVPRFGGRFDRRSRVRQLVAHLRLDARFVLRSPVSAVLLTLAVIATLSEATSTTGLLLSLPVRPVTSQMLGFFRYALLQFVLLLIVFYSGALVHRDREHRVADIVGAAPCPDWVPMLSKALALWLGVLAVLVVSITATVALQVASGHRDLDLMVYAEGVLAYDGFYFGLLATLALVIQVLSANRWSGSALVVLAFGLLLSLESLGFEGLLYGFRIPIAVHTDFNGFGHFRAPALSLMAYWTAGAALLLIVGALFITRGPAKPLVERVHEARRRLTRPAVFAAAIATAAFVGLGGWVFYNTHVLNAFATTTTRLEAQAAYERQFQRYKDAPGPSMTRIDAEVHLYPEERRLTSRGTITLVNGRASSLGEIMISVDPRLRVDTLSVARGTLARRDEPRGVYVFTLADQLQAGESIELTWNAERTNRGFPNSNPDNDIVANGSFVEFWTIAPLPAYDEGREITDPVERQRHGLPPASQLPPRDDARALRTVGFGVDRRVDTRLVVSTTPGQTAVAPGVMVREWQSSGRRYFEYRSERPIWPVLMVASADYALARARPGNVGIEVYYHPEHAWNVPIISDTAARAIEYFGREFAPYPYSHFRVVEYPGYRSAARAFPGTIPYSERAGFLTDLSDWAPIDYTTLHELAHMWWGHMAAGARVQGREVLNETLAQYSTLMFFKQQDDPRWLRRVTALTLDAYLDGRSRDTRAEHPLVLTDDQGNISYNKGPLVLFALQDLIGAEKVHAALRSYLARFALKPAPFPTARDLLTELRAVTPAEYQDLLTDWFERIVLYDARVETATAMADDVAGRYVVTMEVAAQRFQSSGGGIETEAPLDAWFDVVIFADASGPDSQSAPLYRAKHRLRSGSARIEVRVDGRPSSAGVDPFHVMIDRVPANNTRAVSIRE